MRFIEKFNLGVWNVGVIETSAAQVINNQGKCKIRWMKHNYKDRFFADPFLFDVDEYNYYILAEEFPFYSNLGFISLLTVSKSSMKLLKKEKWIEELYHLSYPFVYEKRIIPEAYRSGMCYSYCIKDKKAVKDTLIMPRGLIDQTIIKKDDHEWLFATDADNPLCGLKVFYRKMGEVEWHEHKMNPVSEDICSARPGGHFFEMDGKLYRPAQDSQKNYGNQIRIMRIDELTPDNYQETEICCISSAENPPFVGGLHTFNEEKDFVLVDGYLERKSFFILPLCIKLPSVMKFFGEHL